MDNTLIGLTPEQVKEFCQKHHIRFMAFFGSVVRDDFRPDSDLDVLVKFEPNHIPGFEFFLIEAELSKQDVKWICKPKIFSAKKSARQPSLKQ